MRPNNNETTIFTYYIYRENKMKLHDETAKQIASMFNSVVVNKLLAESDEDNAVFWMAEEYKKIIQLAETFNIILPTYDLAVRNLKRSIYKNATLTMDKI